MDVNSKIANLRASVSRIAALSRDFSRAFGGVASNIVVMATAKSQTTGLSDTNHSNFEALIIDE